jgi:hypothetical protein
MKRYLIQTGTVTYAIKGRDLLRRKGIKAKIERKTTAKAQGCGYAIVVDGDIVEAQKILRENGVKILDITEEI